jgi:hypothetical protein
MKSYRWFFQIVLSVYIVFLLKSLADGQELKIIRLELLPKDIIIASGDTAQFIVIAYTSANTAFTPQNVIWETTAGIIDKTGRFNAGNISGQYIVSARTGSFKVDVPIEVINARAPATNPGRIVGTLWDVGGENFLAPVAKISVDVFGTDTSQIKLFSINSNGEMAELQSFTCRDGSKINFSTKYDRYRTEMLEIHLYDNKGNLMTSTKRKVH